MLPKHEPQSKFGKWLLKYRLLITVFLFVFLVPLAFIVALYLGDYLKYQSVVFGEDTISDFESTYITIEENTNHEEINLETDELIYKIKLVSIVIPEFTDDPGSYSFRVKYEAKPNKTVSAISATLILQTEWIDAKSQPRNVSTGLNYGSVQPVTFNKILPVSPLWFVTVERPYLYVKITYQIAISMGQQETRTHYFKTNLVGLTPSTVIDANA